MTAEHHLGVDVHFTTDYCICSLINSFTSFNLWRML